MAKSAEQSNKQKLVKASARHLRIAPRKMRLVTNLVKGMNVGDAVIELQHNTKKGAPMLLRLLKSAAANAKNNLSLDPDFLYIKSITTDMGNSMKRYFPRARGSAFVIRRKMSHVNVILEEKRQVKAVKSKVSLFKKMGTAEPASLDQIEATKIGQEKEQPKKPEIFKSDQQIKMNKIQQKRRLFDRRGGE